MQLQIIVATVLVAIGTTLSQVGNVTDIDVFESAETFRCTFEGLQETITIDNVDYSDRTLTIPGVEPRRTRRGPRPRVGSARLIDGEGGSDVLAVQGIGRASFVEIDALGNVRAISVYLIDSTSDGYTAFLSTNRPFNPKTQHTGRCSALP